MPKGIIVTDEQREEIQELLVEKTVPQVARKLRLSKSTVARVKNGAPTGKHSSRAKTFPVLMHLTQDEVNKLIKVYGLDIIYKFRKP